MDKEFLINRNHNYYILEKPLHIKIIYVRIVVRKKKNMKFVMKKNVTLKTYLI